MIKCPFCGNVLQGIAAKAGITDIDGTPFHTVTYSCPSCFKVISCQIDPTLLRNNINQQVTHTGQQLTTALGSTCGQILNEIRKHNNK